MMTATSTALIQRVCSAPLARAVRTRALATNTATATATASLSTTLTPRASPADSRVLLGLSEPELQQLALDFSQDIYPARVMYMVLELLCLKCCLEDEFWIIADHPGTQLVEWAKPYLASKHRALKIFDARIEGQYSVPGALKAANLANQCLSAEPEFRPNMNEVVTALEQLQESGDTEDSGISQNEPRQTPCANSSNRRRSTSWISFRPCASHSYT